MDGVIAFLLLIGAFYALAKLRNIACQLERIADVVERADKRARER
jgi:hypothetical protein